MTTTQAIKLLKNGEAQTYTHADLEKKLGETFNYKGK